MWGGYAIETERERDGSKPTKKNYKKKVHKIVNVQVPTGVTLAAAFLKKKNPRR